jgi:thiopurine S-methyltransferase
MDADFWLEKWQSNQLGFHLDEVNPLLVEYFNQLPLPANSRVFLPLCGKTLGLEPDITNIPNGLHYAAPDIDVFVCDIFSLSCELLGHIDAIYDRAALIALPMKTRELYTRLLTTISRTAPQLLVTLSYDQDEMGGPPFAVSDDEVGVHYGCDYKVTLAASAEVPGGLKGQCAAYENAWLLNPAGERVVASV